MQRAVKLSFSAAYASYSGRLKKFEIFRVHTVCNGFRNHFQNENNLSWQSPDLNSLLVTVKLDI